MQGSAGPGGLLHLIYVDRTLLRMHHPSNRLPTSVLPLCPIYSINAPIMPRASSSGIPNPAASQQTKFRVNPKRSYSERMSETRAEIRRIMKEALRAITQDPSAAMRWPSYWKDIVCKYRVVVEGWPYNEVPFRNLSDVSNLQKLEILLRGWQSGQIYFRRLPEVEFEVLSATRAAQIEAAQGQGLGTQMDDPPV